MDQRKTPRPDNSESGKAKYRPQQSCLRCRERKVKCDRAKPCGACCARGLESECQYTTNSEERFQIGQAETIENLRRQVRELRKLLRETQPPGESGSSGDLQVEVYRPFGASEVQASHAAAASDSPGLVPQSRAVSADAFQNSGSTGNVPIGFAYDQPIAPANSTAGILSDPERWKGKTVILQEILDTISACDDSRISPLVHIIRTSPTPEDAFMSIYQSIQ
ncbi:transcriptional regulator family: Fungal Specific TF [Paecilomyces variotii]|nr:transcriptional regulator family: Fungal Specific TF [Paecilomyces variotii]